MIDFPAAKTRALATLMDWLPGAGQAEKRGDELWACNPLRADSSPGSFSVNLCTGIYYDFADNSSGDALGLYAGVHSLSVAEAAKWLAPASTLPTTEKPMEHLVATYPYFNADGSPWTTVRRYESYDEQGKRVSKRFLPIQPNGTYKLPKGPRPLYRLREILGHPDDPVLVVEGEKCADAAANFFTERGLDLVAASWHGGSQATEKTDWAPLANRDVFLWPDRDPPGRKAMESIASRLSTSRVRVVAVPPGFDDGKDIADFLEEGCDVKTLIEEAFAAEAHDFEGLVDIQRRGELEAVAATIHPVSMELLRLADIPPRIWFIDGLVTFGLTLIQAKKGLGKTWFALQAALAMATGCAFLGRSTMRARILCAELELDETSIHERARRLGPLPEGLDVVDAWPTGEAGIRALEAAIVVLGYRVVIVDNLPGILPSDHETNSYDDQPFYARIRKIGHKYNAAIIGLWHAGKAEREDHVDSAIGSTGKVAQCDSVLTLVRKRGETGGKLLVAGNHGKDDAISLRFEDCLWTLADGAAEGPSLSAADQVYMDLLGKHPEGLSCSILSATVGKSSTAGRSALHRLAVRGLVLKRGTLWYPSGAFDRSPPIGARTSTNAFADRSDRSPNVSERERTLSEGETDAAFSETGTLWI